MRARSVFALAIQVDENSKIFMTLSSSDSAAPARSFPATDRLPGTPGLTRCADTGDAPGFELQFFAPLLEAVRCASNLRSCRKLPDERWAVLGVRRALGDHPSGRAFLQQLAASGEDAPERSHFFETLASSRRLDLIREASAAVASSMPPLDADPCQAMPELEGFDLYAGDGHFHAAAAHDRRDPLSGSKDAVGHFFALNLRTHALRHIDVADQVERRKEHDMRAIKRQGSEAMRMGAPRKRKVMLVWDRAGIDFQLWYRWKTTAGVYFISRQKDNMKLETVGLNRWDASDPVNHGVLSDELVSTSQGVAVRRIGYRCAVRGQNFEFITSEYTLRPGAIAHLYRMRWEIEKVFDQFKNKLGETKAWASSAQAKAMQAGFLCLAHNLMVLCEQMLERHHGLRNEAEWRRRTEVLRQQIAAAAKAGHLFPSLLAGLQRLTVRSVKFIRWLRVQLFHRPRSAPDIDTLRRFYAVL